MTRAQLKDKIGRLVIVIQSNYPQPYPCNSKEYYNHQRSHIRRLRRDSPRNMDVLYWEQSLGLDKWNTEVTVRRTYDWPTKDYITLPRNAMPGRLQTGLDVHVNGPVGKLP